MRLHYGGPVRSADIGHPKLKGLGVRKKFNLQHVERFRYLQSRAFPVQERYTMLWNMLGNRVDLGTGGRLSTIYMAPASMWVMPRSCSVPRCRRRLPPIYSILAIKWGFLKQFQRVAAR